MILLVILTLPNISDFLQPFEPSIIPELISAFIDKCVSELLILPVSMGKLGLCNPFASAFLALHFRLLQPYSRQSLYSKFISVQQLLVPTKANTMSVRQQWFVSQQSEITP